MLITAHDYKGVLLTHAIPSGSIIYAAYYHNFLENPKSNNG
jgi:hypothetical protein